MSEADWKLKYRDSLQEADVAEKRWQLTEQALRRLVGRLCAAGMGVDPKLDDELVALAAANRRNADAMELERLAVSLTSAVVAVDAVSPVPTIITKSPVFSRWDSSCTAAAGVLQRVRTLGAENALVLDLIARLPKAGCDGELAAILDKTAGLIGRQVETLAGERLEAASILADVTERLEDMAGFLTESGDEFRSRCADVASVNDNVMTQVRELNAEVKGATELRALQHLVSVGLESVTKQVLSFRSRDEVRQLEHTARAERMAARIAALERETQDLGMRLDLEKQDARFDPLTRLPNRKSFDERLALEVLRRSEGDLPVCMLVWDVDNFKLINDSYGHRAGDRVLQSVATCFNSGLRPEDFVARIGGEEFVVLLTGTPFERALQIADELRLSVAALRFHFKGKPIRVTVSCGATELRSGDAGVVAFDRADAALYRAKSGGKNLCIAA